MEDKNGLATEFLGKQGQRLFIYHEDTLIPEITNFFKETNASCCFLKSTPWLRDAMLRFDSGVVCLPSLALEGRVCKKNTWDRTCDIIETQLKKETTGLQFLIDSDIGECSGSLRNRTRIDRRKFSVNTKIVSVVATPFLIDGGNILSMPNHLFVGAHSRVIYDALYKEHLLAPTFETILSKLCGDNRTAVEIAQVFWHLDLFMFCLDDSTIVIPKSDLSVSMRFVNTAKEKFIETFGEVFNSIAEKLGTLGYNVFRLDGIFFDDDGKICANYFNCIVSGDAMLGYSFGSQYDDYIRKQLAKLVSHFKATFIGDPRENILELRVLGGAFHCTTA
jgi:hypothetical protein